MRYERGDLFIFTIHNAETFIHSTGNGKMNITRRGIIELHVYIFMILFRT